MVFKAVHMLTAYNSLKVLSFRILFVVSVLWGIKTRSFIKHETQLSRRQRAVSTPELKPVQASKPGIASSLSDPARQRVWWSTASGSAHRSGARLYYTILQIVMPPLRYVTRLQLPYLVSAVETTVGLSSLCVRRAIQRLFYTIELF